MNIAELFVNLGVKGSEKTVGAIANLQKGLKETASTSLEAKAAIVGAMYALERLFATSGKAGTDLTNFNTLMGGGMIQTLQKYQYAARQVGISNEEMEGTFKSLSDLSAKTLLGKARPEGAAYVANRTKTDLNPLLKAAADGHPELLLQKLQQFAQMEKNIGMRNQVLKSFGLGDNMIAGMARNAFTPQALRKAPTYSDKEVGALDKANIAWSNLGTKIEMAVGHFNAQHGGQLVKDISAITDKVLAMAEAFAKFADKVELFKGIGKIFEGWGYIFNGITDAVTTLEEFLAKKDKDTGKTESVWNKNIGGTADDDILNRPPLKIDWEKLPGMFETFIHDVFDGKKPEPGAKVPAAKTQPAPATSAKVTSEKITIVNGKAAPTAVPAKTPFNLREALGFAPQAPVAPSTAGIAPVAPTPAKAPTAPVAGVAPVAPTPAKAPTAPGAVVPTPKTGATVVPILKAVPRAAPMQLNPKGEPSLEAKPGTPAEASLRLVVPPSPVAPTPAAAAAPTVSPSLAGAVNTQNIDVTQTLNFNHEGKDAARTGDSTKKAVQAAFRQMSAQAQGT